MVRDDDLGYAVRLAADPLSHAILHPPPDKYLIAFPLLLYKALFETFGMDSYRPYRVIGVLPALLCAGLLFALLRRWLPERFAVRPTLLMLSSGPGPRWWSPRSGFRRRSPSPPGWG